jgi:hypothetical protein
MEIAHVHLPLPEISAAKACIFVQQTLVIPVEVE